MEHWLAPGKAARLLSVSTRTLQRWEEKGRLRSVRIPTGHRRYPLSDLLRILRGRHK